jgi:segregation and condensation protein B
MSETPDDAPKAAEATDDVKRTEDAARADAVDAPTTADATPAVADESPDGSVADDLTPVATDAPPIDVAAVEALLFATHHPLTAGRLAELMELPSTKPIRAAITALNADYEASGRSFRVEQVAGGYQLLTLPEYGDRLKRLVQKDNDAKLTKAAIETLAIVAYKQPILRVDVEGIRGVACGEAIRGLMEKHLVKIAGRAEEPGRPILYGTTKRFLEVFGLNSLTELPSPDQGLKPKAEG